MSKRPELVLTPPEPEPEPVGPCKVCASPGARRDRDAGLCRRCWQLSQARPAGGLRLREPARGARQAGLPFAGLFGSELGAAQLELGELQEEPKEPKKNAGPPPPTLEELLGWRDAEEELDRWPVELAERYEGGGAHTTPHARGFDAAFRSASSRNPWEGRTRGARRPYEPVPGAEIYHGWVTFQRVREDGSPSEPTTWRRYDVSAMHVDGADRWQVELYQNGHPIGELPREVSSDELAPAVAAFLTGLDGVTQRDARAMARELARVTLPRRNPRLPVRRDTPIGSAVYVPSSRGWEVGQLVGWTRSNEPRVKARRLPNGELAPGRGKVYRLDEVYEAKWGRPSVGGLALYGSPGDGIQPETEPTRRRNPARGVSVRWGVRRLSVSRSKLSAFEPVISIGRERFRRAAEPVESWGASDPWSPSSRALSATAARRANADALAEARRRAELAARVEAELLRARGTKATVRHARKLTR